MGQLVRKAEGAESSGKPVFRITAATLDRHLDRMLSTALKVEHFADNPVVLWNHDDREPAVGTARVYQEGGEWLAEVSFSQVTQRARDVAGLVDDGTLRTCSIGFIVLDYEKNDEGGYTYTLVELVELSITNIPAVREAQRVKTTTGKNGDVPPEAPPEGEASKAKALEQGDLDAFAALLDEKLKPVMGLLTQLHASMGTKSEEPPAEEPPEDKAEEEPAPPAEEPPPEEEKSGSGTVRRGFAFIAAR
ncbi:MAG TPA: HK97 family phage prohead protease [Archangium sp.]|nr:HK97 family phage prohead protease [Archangium sp.]